MATFFGIHIVVSYKSGEAVQTSGDESWPHVRVSNVPVVDGAGNAAAHFRYLWAKQDPLEEAINQKHIPNPVSSGFGCIFKIHALPTHLIQPYSLGAGVNLSWQVGKEFPDVEIEDGRVSINQFGYRAAWKVGKDAKNLVEAATLATRVLGAGHTQYNKLVGLKRPLACNIALCELMT